MSEFRIRHPFAIPNDGNFMSYRLSQVPSNFYSLFIGEMFHVKSNRGWQTNHAYISQENSATAFQEPLSSPKAVNTQLTTGLPCQLRTFVNVQSCSPPEFWQWALASALFPAQHPVGNCNTRPVEATHSWSGSRSRAVFVSHKMVREAGELVHYQSISSFCPVNPLTPEKKSYTHNLSKGKCVGVCPVAART